MGRQVGGRVPDLVLRILGIVPAEKRPGPLPALPVNVLGPGRAGLVRQHGDPRAQRGFHEGRGEPIEIRNHLPMILETEKSEWREKGKVAIDPLDEMNLNTLRGLREGDGSRL